jgi:hypothetical protein
MSVLPPKADIGSATLPIATVIACYGGAKLTGAHFQKPGSAARCYITRADTCKFGELKASSPEAKKIKPLRPLADLRRLCRITIMHLSIASFEHWRDISFIKSILRNCFIVRGATVSEADHVVPGRKFSL